MRNPKEHPEYPKGPRESESRIAPGGSAAEQPANFSEEVTEIDETLKTGTGSGENQPKFEIAAKPAAPSAEKVDELLMLSKAANAKKVVENGVGIRPGKFSHAGVAKGIEEALRAAIEARETK